MNKKLLKFCLLFSLIFYMNNLYADILKRVDISGNKRISEETIKVYGDIEINKDYNNNDVNEIIKKLYQTDFFTNITTDFSNGVLKINVIENPIIYSIYIEGEQTSKFKDQIFKIISLKEKGSYIENYVKSDLEIIKNFYKSLGYYSVKASAQKQASNIGDGTLNLIFSIDKGERSQIRKIYFIGDKKIKSKRLRDVIVSEEAKFWKFLTRNIYLNAERIELDKRLIKNYYLGRGYYDVQVLSSSAKVNDFNDIELTFSINAGKRYRFKKISTDIDPVFDKSVFEKLKPSFTEIVGEYYSPFKIKTILENIDQIIDDNQMQFVQHSVSETSSEDGIDIVFKISEGKKLQIERVNIKGNTVTNDSVIRSTLLLDEGDPYSKIKIEKSISNLKAKNIFNRVNYKIIDGSSPDLKVFEISVEERPTGEISAGAGYGTEGGVFAFSIKENNYLGKGYNVSATADISEDALRGGIRITNPDYNFTGNKVFGGFSSRKTDKPDSGYKNTILNFSTGTEFEHLKDLYVSPEFSLSFDDLNVNNKASSSLKKQAGNYSDLTFKYGILNDKRNRRFMPTDGHVFKFSQGLPLIADAPNVFNSITYNKYHAFNDNVIGALKFYSAAVNGAGEDVRLSKRLHLNRKLRGFESGKVGPKDGQDFIGGNYATALNLEAALPNLLPESTETDISVFMDLGNLWHVDYSSTVEDSNKIRSSVGLATNLYTPVGPLSFVFAQDLSKANTDQTQTFRFQIGTSF